jgi:outer membrane protein OmpA-like peptidoglycan-associated protein
MSSVVDAAREALTGNVVSQMSSLLHESESGTRRVLEEAVPVSLAGLAGSASTEAGAQSLLNTFEKADYSQFDPSDIGRAVADPGVVDRVAASGEGLAGRLFGNRLGGVVNGLAGEGGVNQSSAAKLLGLAMPLVMGIVGKQAASRHLDARGLSGFLGEQARLAGGSVLDRLGGMFGPTPAMAGGPATPRYQPQRTSEIYHGRRGASFLPWVVAGLVLLAGLLWLNARRHGLQNARRPVATAPATPTPAARPQVGAATNAPSPANAPSAGTTSPALSVGGGALANALGGRGSLPARFVVPGLAFRLDSAEIEPSTAPVLDEVASALAAHPSAKVWIEGHTDTLGNNDEAAVTLSKQRAESVKNYLTQHGVAAEQLTTAGFGASKPLATNDTAEGRAQNRRMELVLTSR